MNKKADDSQVEQLQKQIEEWKGKYLRALADYQNLEKRISIERQEDIKFATRNIILKLLAVLDSLEKLEETVKDQGLELALKQFKEVLHQEGIVKIGVVGKKFDPHLMECIEVVESDKDSEILEEYQKGYMMHDKILRVARVKVGKKKVEKIEQKT